MMKSWILLLAGLFVLGGFVPSATAGCHETDACGPGGPDNDSGEEGNSTDNATNSSEGNTSEGETPSSNDPPGRSDKGSRQDEAERRKAQARAWKDAMDSRGTDQSATAREADLDKLPDHVRDRLGLLVETDGRYQGTFVSFVPDQNAGVLRDVRSGETLLFSEIYAPLDLGTSASMRVAGKTFQVSGDDWRFRLTDHPTAAMNLQTADGDRYMLVVPETTTVSAEPFGVTMIYPTGDGTGRTARLVGMVVVDPEDPGVLFVDGEATFHLSAKRALLQGVSNMVRPAIESAMTERKLGAETTVLRANNGIFDETVLYEDLSVAIETGAREVPADMTGYTITVSADHRPGKTIVVTFEEGLIDPDQLTFRYWNVLEDHLSEAMIAEAASLEDVLEPSGDGAKFWVVPGSDGTQVLLAIPHFSVHQIEILSVVDFVLERPSLVLGTIGAALVVSLATMAMFRRPEDA